MMMVNSSRKKYLYDEIVERIEEMIRDGELRIGDQIPPERTLAAVFRVSRNCIRQAVQALSEKGVLESRRGAGTFVSARSQAVLVDAVANAIQAQKELIAEIMQFRLLMEPQVASLAAANITCEQLDRLKVIVCDQERKILAGDRDSDLDAAFHRLLAEASANRIVVTVASTLDHILNESRSEFLQTDGRRRASIVAHLRIIDALEARDPDRAFKAMRDHLLEVDHAISGT